MLRDRAFERVARGGVHAARRLVEQEQLGAADGDRRDRDPLALAPGQAARVVVGEVLEPERLEPVVDGAVGVTAEEPEGLGHLGPHGRGEQQRVRVLGHVRGGRPRLDAPGVGASSPPRMRSSVLLPAPLRPSSATTSPRWISTSIPCSTGRRSSATPMPCARSSSSPGRARGSAGRAIGSGRCSIATARARASRTVSGGGSQPSRRPSRVTLGAPGIVREDRAGWGGRDRDATTVQLHGPVGEGRGPFEPVLGEQDRGAEVGVESTDRGEDVVGALRIELRRRLVEHQRAGAAASAPAIAQR